MLGNGEANGMTSKLFRHHPGTPPLGRCERSGGTISYPPSNIPPTPAVSPNSPNPHLFFSPILESAWSPGSNAAPAHSRPLTRRCGALSRSAITMIISVLVAAAWLPLALSTPSLAGGSAMPTCAPFPPVAPTRPPSAKRNHASIGRPSTHHPAPFLIRQPGAICNMPANPLYLPYNRLSVLGGV